MHHAHMLLGGAQVAGILEGQPRVARFIEHGQHFAPQIQSLDGLEVGQLAPGCLLLVFDIALGEGLPVELVQVAGVVGGEQGPVAFLADAPHEQVRDPVGGVHVVGAAAVVAGVLAQVQELLDVQVPGFQIGAHGPLALAALVHRDGGVVGDLEEWHHALGLAVGAFDVRPHGAHSAPVVAQAAGELRQQGVVLDGAENAVQVVWHRA